MKREHLKEYFSKFYTGTLLKERKEILREQDEEEGDDEEVGGLFDDAEDDEGGEEGDDDAADEGGEDEKPATDEKEEKPELSPQDYIQYGSTVTQELTSVFDDFAAGAMKVDAAKSSYLTDPDEKILPESIAKALYEQKETGDEFDMSFFSGEVARLINNYQNLLDMESLIYVQAKEYLLKRFNDEGMIEEFDKFIKEKHKLDLDKPLGEDEYVFDPVAAGASTGAAG